MNSPVVNIHQLIGHLIIVSTAESTEALVADVEAQVSKALLLAIAGITVPSEGNLTDNSDKSEQPLSGD